MSAKRVMNSKREAEIAQAEKEYKKRAGFSEDVCD